jgi:hypothetical protein
MMNMWISSGKVSAKMQLETNIRSITVFGGRGGQCNLADDCKECTASFFRVKQSITIYETTQHYSHED